jgi:hypothetical protein
MARAVARLAAVGSLITVLVVASFSPAYADGALGLNGPTGEPLPWTLAAVVGLSGAAFLVRAVLRLRAAPQPSRSPSVSGANPTAQPVPSLDPAGSLLAPNSSLASRSSADAVPAR